MDPAQETIKANRIKETMENLLNKMNVKMSKWEEDEKFMNNVGKVKTLLQVVHLEAGILGLVSWAFCNFCSLRVYGHLMFLGYFRYFM